MKSYFIFSQIVLASFILPLFVCVNMSCCRKTTKADKQYYARRAYLSRVLTGIDRRIVSGGEGNTNIMEILEEISKANDKNVLASTNDEIDLYVYTNTVEWLYANSDTIALFIVCSDNETNDLPKMMGITFGRRQVDLDAEHANTVAVIKYSKIRLSP